MAWTHELPGSYQPLVGRPDELEELRALIERHEMAVAGTSTATVDALETQFGEPRFNAATDIVTVRSADGDLVAAAHYVNRAPHVTAWTQGYVDPAHVGLGIGSALLTWAEGRASTDVALAPAGARVAITAGANDLDMRAKRLFERRGYEPERYFLEMSIDLGHDVEVSPLPDGIALRTLDAQEGLEPMATMIASAFRDHFGFTDAPIEERVGRWNQWRTSDMWDDDLVWLAEADGTIVGANVSTAHYGAKTHSGYIATLGVVPDWRGRGLAKALLTTAFAEYRRRGKTAVALHVDADSLTGATRLYEAVGMREVERHLDYEKELRAGEDLVVR
ncbi:MAG: GNAT family N-acetyltransferase [Acidimicrobiia bacterium]|nr:GNAT family N-acetyltransferase [Acidimicrobiia bacterium]